MSTIKSIAGLTPRHLRIVDLSVKGLGVKDIAEELGMSSTMVGIVRNSPTFKHEFALRRAFIEEREGEQQVQDDDEVMKTLRDGAKKAAEKLVDHLDSPEDSTSVKSCTEILDRSGYGKKREESVAAVAAIVINSEDSRLIIETLEIDGRYSKKTG